MNVLELKPGATLFVSVSLVFRGLFPEFGENKVLRRHSCWTQALRVKMADRAAAADREDDDVRLKTFYETL